MQVRTPAGEPGSRVGLDDVPNRHEAKQAGLDHTLLAAHAGTHDGHTRRAPLGSYGHCGQVYRVRKAPAPGQGGTRGTYAAGEAGGEAGGASGAPGGEPDGSSGADGSGADGSGVDGSGPAASGLMSIRQPV